MTESSQSSYQDQSSASEQQSQPQQAAYVVSQNTGHSAHPDQIIASCQALQAHIQKLQEDAVATIKKWQDSIKERELMEKRRVAPGWLDMDQKMLVPERQEPLQTTPHEVQNIMEIDHPTQRSGQDGGEELDRAFGGLGLR